MPTEPSKTCTKCKVEKPLTAFHRYRRNGKSFPRPRCIVCLREDHRLFQAQGGGRDAAARYWKSPKGKATMAKYQATPKGKAAKVRAEKNFRATGGRQRATKRKRDKYPEKHSANRAVQRAVRQGVLLKPLGCEACQTPHEPRRLQGHHWEGYGVQVQLDVQWLCQKCHTKVHRTGVTTHE